MSVLSYCLVRSTKISSVISASVTKRSYQCLVRQKELTCSKSTPIDKHGVFTVPKRTLIRKRKLIGTNNSSHLKPNYKKDKVGPDYEFIYCSSNIRLYLYWTPMIFILIISGLGLCAKVIVESHWYEKDFENVGFRLEYVDTLNPLYASYIVSIIMLCFLVSAVRYLGTVILRLYHNKSTNEFVAILLKYGVYRKKVHFKPSDVERIENFQLKGNVKIKGIPVTVSESNFTSSPGYNIFMGYSPSRPSEYKEQQGKDDIVKTLETLRDAMEKKRKDDFLEKYEQKRKQRRLKDR